MSQSSRFRSLDLLRPGSGIVLADRSEPITSVRRKRISPPTFLKSSTALVPILASSEGSWGYCTFSKPSESTDTTQSRRGEPHSAANNMLIEDDKGLAPEQHLSVRGGLHLQTPRRARKPSQQLKSKFSMSPDHRPKRSKSRVQESKLGAIVDSGQATSMPHLADKASFASWSLSWGSATKKTQRKKPARGAERSTLDSQPGTLSGTASVTTKPVLKPTTSFATFRRFLTPSKSKRNVCESQLRDRSSKLLVQRRDHDRHRELELNTALSATPQRSQMADEATRSWDKQQSSPDRPKGSLNGSASPEVVKESKRRRRESNRASEHSHGSRSKIDVRRPSNENSSEPKMTQRGYPPKHISSDLLRELHNKKNLSGSDPLHTEGYIAQPQLDRAKNDSTLSPLTKDELPDHSQAGGRGPEASGIGRASRFKTLHLLARKPFMAFSRRNTSKEEGLASSVAVPSRSWWARNTSSGPTGAIDVDKQHERSKEAGENPVCNSAVLGVARRSEDLLSKGAPKMFERSLIGQKSRSMDLDRMQTDSKVIPIWPTGLKRRPTLPESFVNVTKPSSDSFEQNLPSQAPLSLSALNRCAPTNVESMISDRRHPWMRELKLQAHASIYDGVEPEKIPERPSDSHTAQAVSSLALSVSLVEHPGEIKQGVAPRPSEHRSLPKRPPSVLLNQSLPIPPRTNRSRASTVSSQSSTTSSPSGKVIVSRRSYGRRLRSPRRADETSSINTVGTSILFHDSPSSSPLMKLGSGLSRRQQLYGSPQRIRSPQLGLKRGSTVDMASFKFSPDSRKGRRLAHLSSQGRSRDETVQDDDAQEWIDEEDETPMLKEFKLVSVPQKFDDSVSPKTRPGFLEMDDATTVLGELVDDFNDSSGCISLYSPRGKGCNSPYSRVDCGGILSSLGRDEHGADGAKDLVGSVHLNRSIVSLLSTEANSSFEDSEELQKLIESMMAADVTESSIGNASYGDLALLSPFGSPADSRNNAGISKDPDETARFADSNTSSAARPPPPKFLLNDRPISPPDTSSDLHHVAESDEISVQGSLVHLCLDGSENPQSLLEHRIFPFTTFQEQPFSEQESDPQTSCGASPSSSSDKRQLRFTPGTWHTPRSEKNDDVEGCRGRFMA